jgi:hypothetical protein
MLKADALLRFNSACKEKNFKHVQTSLEEYVTITFPLNALICLVAESG